MSKSTKKALVLSSVSRTVLAVIRSLGRGGVEVHSAWSRPNCISLRSRYVHATHDLPPYSETDLGWKTALGDLMRRERFDLVVPCTDIDTLALHRHRADLEPCGRIYTPNEEAVAVLFDKHRTNALARDAGVRLPRELIVSDIDSGREAWRQFGAPLVLKPSRTFDHAAQGLAVRKVRSETELMRVLPKFLAYGPVAAQQNFIGHGAGIELLLDRGEPLLAFQHVRVHEPLEGGQSAYRKSVALSPDLLDAALRILRPVRYTGIAMVEFKVNPSTGDWIFVEVNARFWGSLPLSIAAGADFPLALFEFLVSGRRDFPQHYRTGIFARNLPLDLDWQIANLHADRHDPTLATKSLPAVAGETIANVLTLRERWDSLTLDDPAPGIAEIRELTQRAFARLIRSRGALDAEIV
jgi:predicted ATP-grasp superfamily ATP-dependent carboligase